ncbi:MAG: hypothetical protein HKN65_11395 [Woeseiaceae bacterium]|nr:hypothetical protein [Woeseiaceae bacterium]
MGNPLRERRSAAEWAAGTQAVEIAGIIGDFDRLSSIIEADLGVLEADKIPAQWRDSPVTGRLEFGFADAQQMLPVVDCRVTATIDATCQRCLEAFRLPLEVEERLLLLGLEETVDGYDDCEVWELEDTLLRPQDIVEELLIIAVPFAAMHTESAACRALAPVAEQAADEMTTPFAALREQMAKDNEGSG